jgi:hypothetical protein
MNLLVFTGSKQLSVAVGRSGLILGGNELSISKNKNIDNIPKNIKSPS